jgi:heterodisulfide reductase subunit A2
VTRRKGGEPDAAANRLMAQAVATVSGYTPLHWHPEPVVPRALVVGAGISGIKAALTLADGGFPVTVVDKAAGIGGFLAENAGGLEGPELAGVFADLVARVKTHPKVELITNGRVTGFTGRQGKFAATVECGDGPVKDVRSIEHGAAIIAIGTQGHNPAAYLYGTDGVVTGSEARSLLTQGAWPVKAGSTYALIQCVESRCTERSYCSRTCCLEAVDNALAIKQHDPAADVYLFYRDLRTPGFFEKRFLDARRAGVIFVQYDVETPPTLTKDAAGRLTLAAIDPASRRKLLLQPDKVILAAPQVAQPEAAELAQLFHIQCNADGFLMETHSNLGSVAFPNGGIFIAGAAQGPQPVAECLSQAQGVAARAMRILSQPFLLMGGTVAEVDADKCAACLTCVRVCPFSVPKINRDKKPMGSAAIAAAECRGCGICAAECPNRAVELRHYEVGKITERIGIALTEVN